MSYSELRATVMAAGEGTRLSAFTQHPAHPVDKPLIRVGYSADRRDVSRGIAPIEIVVGDLALADVTEITFLVNERSRQIPQTFGTHIDVEHLLQAQGRLANLVNHRTGVISCHYVEQPADYLHYGTGAVALAVQPETRLIVESDGIMYDRRGRSILPRLLDATRQSGVQAAMLVAPFPPGADIVYGAVEAEQLVSGQLVLRQIHEDPLPLSSLKPSKGVEYYKNVSRYSLTPYAVAAIKKIHDEHRPPGECRITTAFDQLAATGGGRVEVIPIDDPELGGFAGAEYLDCGTPEGLLYADGRFSGFNAQSPVWDYVAAQA
jgi:UTP-glucose-1-phosphate uridylyltransferase